MTTLRIFAAIAIPIISFVMELAFVFGVQENSDKEIKIGIMLDLLIYVCAYTHFGHPILFGVLAVLVPIVTIIVTIILTPNKEEDVEETTSSITKE